MATPVGETHNYPEKWEEYKKEIDFLLRTFDKNYEKRKYISPSLYIYHIEEKPWNYPILNGLKPAILKRYVSYHLKEQGRVARGTKAKTSVWMLQE